MCEINGLWGLCKGWAGTLKDTPNEGSNIACWNTIDRNILRRLLPLPFFLFPDNSCKTQMKIQQIKYSIWAKILLQISHFSEIKWERFRSRANSLRVFSDCHRTEAGFRLLFARRGKRPQQPTLTEALSKAGKGGML